MIHLFVDTLMWISLICLTGAVFIVTVWISANYIEHDKYVKGILVILTGIVALSAAFTLNFMLLGPIVQRIK